MLPENKQFLQGKLLRGMLPCPSLLVFKTIFLLRNCLDGSLLNVKSHSCKITFKFCGFKLSFLQLVAMCRDEGGEQSQAEDLAGVCADRELDSLLQSCVIEALMGALQDYSIDSR